MAVRLPALTSRNQASALPALLRVRYSLSSAAPALALKIGMHADVHQGAVSRHQIRDVETGRSSVHQHQAVEIARPEAGEQVGLAQGSWWAACSMG
jgi:hypothetical protein